MGNKVDSNEEDLPFWRAMIAPVACMAVVLFVAIPHDVLVDDWHARPPRNASRFTMTLMRLGPQQVFLYVVSVAILPFAWSLRRIVSPPKIQVLRLQNLN